MKPTESSQSHAPLHHAMTVAEFANGHRLGRTTVHYEIKSGRLRTMKVGTRRLITQEAAADWRALCERETADAVAESRAARERSAQDARG